MGDGQQGRAVAIVLADGRGMVQGAGWADGVELRGPGRLLAASTAGGLQEMQLGTECWMSSRALPWRLPSGIGVHCNLHAVCVL